jgi:multiple sugar transport system permease protein
MLAALMLYAPAHALERDRERRMSLQQLFGKIALWLSVFVIVSPAVLFFLWMLSLSLKFEIDNASYPPVFIPENFAWKNYLDVLASNRFLTYFVNTLIVTGSATLGRCCRRAGRLRHRACRRTSRRSILIARITPACPISFRCSCCSSGWPARHAGAADHHPLSSSPCRS